MPLNPDDWHRRYLEQARWTKNVQNFLFNKSNLADAKNILDVGIGTGALEANLIQKSDSLPFGLDIDHSALNLARKNISSLALVQGDAHRLPFPPGAFEISFCHYVLLWVHHSDQVVAEMKRVTKPGGSVMAIAEPDYGGRIDYPEELSQIGRWQVRALQKQGADPNTGRRLLELFHQAGLIEVEAGVIGGQWGGDLSVDDFDSEWIVIEADLETLNLPPSGKAYLLQLKKQDASSRSGGSRVLYVPTFYAWGKVP